MKTLTLSQAQERVLKDQLIDADRPGPVLRDFQTVLAFVGSEGVPATGKYNLLPIEAIGELDQQLSRPLRLAMKRPLLRSHPYLQGLHLLFRASGLGRVAGTGSKARLVVDAAVLERWRLLNATEQYFTLLEAWLRVGRAEMVGERGRGWGDSLLECQQTWRDLPAQGQQFDLARPQEVYLFGIDRNFYQLALMDLFSLVHVEHPRSAVQPWVPAGVQHTPFGDAVFTLLGQQFLRPWEKAVQEEDENDEEEQKGPPRFGHWQPIFQPYFPEWRQNLVLPGQEAREGIFIFRVALGRTWWRIAIGADESLDTLVDWILRAAHFDDDHLYDFRYLDRYGATVRVLHPYCDEGPWTDEVHIGELPLEIGQSMKLTYDFGDSWQFDVKLEQIEPPGTRRKAPRIVERHGKAPPQYPQWD